MENCVFIQAPERARLVPRNNHNVIMYTILFGLFALTLAGFFWCHFMHHNQTQLEHVCYARANMTLGLDATSNSESTVAENKDEGTTEGSSSEEDHLGFKTKWSWEVKNCSGKLLDKPTSLEINSNGLYMLHIQVTHKPVNTIDKSNLEPFSISLDVLSNSTPQTINRNVYLPTMEKSTAISPSITIDKLFLLMKGDRLMLRYNFNVSHIDKENTFWEVYEIRKP
ncbi:uncharacterized protein LOC142503870 isoform X2 [Ascaphus truei]|uniref:uncharacterized protein LOC142503870 isoform X2 n=1 Tax=Ascaphus truei TaxID=8439 RepID=UPI003F590B59